MGQYRLHVFVCVAGKVCPRQGGNEVLERLKQRVFDAGLRDQVRINKSGCLGQCGYGPMIAIYPDNVWYGAVTSDDAEAIFSEHIVGGRAVARLRYAPGVAGVRVCPPGTETIPLRPQDYSRPRDPQ
ncbi:MAG: (2Fe-2S) ferredoxin domain-containing protein [Planctomycetota bacterium]